MTNKTITIAVVLAILIIGGAIIFTGGLGDIGGERVEERTGNGDLVATVNGVNITREDLNQQLAMLGADLDAVEPAQRAEMEQQILDQLISQRLILQDAENSGVEIDESEIDQMLSDLVAQFGGQEVLEQQLAQAGMTEEELRENIRVDLIINQQVQSVTDDVDLSVSEEEIQQMYDQWTQEMAEFGDPSQELPGIDEVRGDIIAQLEQEKQDPHVLAYIDDLREEADIEILI